MLRIAQRTLLIVTCRCSLLGGVVWRCCIAVSLYCWVLACRLLDRVFGKMDARTRTHFDPTPSSFGSRTSASSPYPGVSYECLTINYTNVSAHTHTRACVVVWVCRVCRVCPEGERVEEHTA